MGQDVFGYVHGNPVILSDPTGHNAVGGAINGIINAIWGPKPNTGNADPPTSGSNPDRPTGADGNGRPAVQSPIEGVDVNSGSGSGFGNRPKVGGARGETEFHKGIDQNAPGGTTIRPWTLGRVAHINTDPTRDTGIAIWLSHSGGYISAYFHMNRDSLALLNTYRVGQQMNLNSVLGYVGDTGHSFGDHLHTEIYSILRNGVGGLDNDMADQEDRHDTFIRDTPVRYYNPRKFYRLYIQ